MQWSSSLTEQTHLFSAIKAGKHVLVEKPHAIDPVGVRQITAAAELAKQKKRPLAQLRQLLT